MGNVLHLKSGQDVSRVTPQRRTKVYAVDVFTLTLNASAAKTSQIASRVYPAGGMHLGVPFTIVWLSAGVLQPLS